MYGLKDFNDRAGPKTAESRNKKINTYKSGYALYERRELILNVFRRWIFPTKTQGKGLRILTPKHMLQRLPIALAQVKTDNTSENLMKLDKSYILCIEQKKLLKKHSTM